MSLYKYPHTTEERAAHIKHLQEVGAISRRREGGRTLTGRKRPRTGGKGGAGREDQR